MTPDTLRCVSCREMLDQSAVGRNRDWFWKLDSQGAEHFTCQAMRLRWTDADLPLGGAHQ